ncbi:MAG: hypothetical protein IJ298_08715 [Ruminococcus sp.]|nr:hypothetical protein [Ruminococcus sp.]
MNKPNKRDGLNLIFSAFLILGYIVCCYFFLTMSATVGGVEPYLNTLVFAVFGLVIFYATRVGEGKPVKRFSLATLLIVDLPALYVILAQLIPALPLHTIVANLGGTTPLDFSPLFILACVALGYGLPYTFFSGFEMVAEDTKNAEDDCGCDCCECIELSGEFVLCEEGVDGALLVVDDYDLEFDPEKEIKLSDVTPANEEIKIGSYVVFVTSEVEIEAEASEETEETEDAEDTADAE